MEQLKDILERIPYTLVLVAALGYIGFGYYQFRTSADSPLTQKTLQVSKTTKENDDLATRIKGVREFYRSLDTKRMELRQLAQQLDEMKATLSDQLDVPSLIKLFVTEAAKVGLTVASIRPTTTKNEDYYGYQSFDLEFRAVYVQLLVFLERLSTVDRIVRIEKLRAAPTNAAGQSSQYVELSGSIELKAYKYLGTKADELGRGSSETSLDSASKPATTAPGSPAGAPAGAPATAPGGAH
jgi:Tfp pilus assembly protein PilO